MDTRSDGNFGKLPWSGIVMFTLGFWLSASLVLDLVIVPGLFVSGMMNQSEFASSGYVIFGLFNRLELICAAVVLCGFLVMRRQHSLSYQQEIPSLLLSAILLIITLVFTYYLTPELSGWSLLSLNLWDGGRAMPPVMISMQIIYWVLEAIKLLTGVTLLRWCYRNACRLV
jgi:hypothetical protein